MSARPTISRPLKFSLLGDVLEQGQRAGAVDRELDRTRAGQRLEAVEVGVEQDARIADDGDIGRIPSGARSLTHATSLLSRSPAWRPTRRGRSLRARRRPATSATATADHDPAPRLLGHVARRHRLRLRRAGRTRSGEARREARLRAGRSLGRRGSELEVDEGTAFPLFGDDRDRHDRRATPPTSHAGVRSTAISSVLSRIAQWVATIPPTITKA